MLTEVIIWWYKNDLTTEGKTKTENLTEKLQN